MAEPRTAVDRVALFAGRHRNPAHERTVEADLRTLLRQGVGTHRMGPDHVVSHRVRPTHLRRAVRDATDRGTGCGAAHRLSRWCALPVRADGRTVSAPRPTVDGALCVVRTLVARAAAASPAAASQKADVVSGFPGPP